MEFIREFIEFHPFVTIALIAGPWCWAVGYWVGLIIQAYTNWLWKGMDKEERYEYIKVAKW